MENPQSSTSKDWKDFCNKSTLKKIHDAEKRLGQDFPTLIAGWVKTGVSMNDMARKLDINRKVVGDLVEFFGYKSEVLATNKQAIRQYNKNFGQILARDVNNFYRY